MVTHVASIRRVKEFASIPTHAGTLTGQEAGAVWLQRRLTDVGFSVELKRAGDPPPYIVAHLATSVSTWLAIYCMYDTAEPAMGPSASGPSTDSAAFMSTHLPLGNKAAIEFFITAVEEAVRARECPSLVLIAEGKEVLGSPGLSELVRDEASLLAPCSAVFWPRLAQDELGRAQMSLGYRGMLGLRLVASARSWADGATTPQLHSRYRPWADAPALRLICAVSSFVSDDGDQLTLSLPESLARYNRASDAELAIELSQAGIVPRDRLGGANGCWQGLCAPSANLEFEGHPLHGVGVIHREAAVRVQFRLPPDLPISTVERSVRTHLDEHGWSDITVEHLYGMNGATPRPHSPGIDCLRRMYAQHEAPVSVLELNLATAPTCAFASVGIPAAVGGLGYQQDHPRPILGLDDAGSRAGVDRTVTGFRDFLRAFGTTSNPGRAQPGARPRDSRLEV